MSLGARVISVRPSAKGFKGFGPGGERSVQGVPPPLDEASYLVISQVSLDGFGVSDGGK